MEKTLTKLKQGIEKHKFDFPRIRRFSFDNDKFKDKERHQFVLFQNNNSVLSETFYLDQKRRYWEIVKKEKATTVKPLYLFSLLKNTILQLLRTFDRIRDQPLLVDTIVQDIWNTKNDNEKGAYNRYIQENPAYLSSEKNRDFSYHFGYSLYTILKNPEFLDQEIADLEQIELITSPEAIITELANKNLVFALSATPDIPRMIKCFNLKWIGENAENYIEPRPQDIHLIEELKAKKDTVRKTQVKFTPNVELEPSHPLYKPLEKLLEFDFYKNKEDSNPSGIGEFRFRRSLKFFGCLDWILNKSQNRTHLIFLHTFNREIRIINGDVNEQHIMSPKLNNVFTAECKGVYNSYKLLMGDKGCNILFLNKDAIENIEEQALNAPSEEAYKAYDALFTDQSINKVILVTQYNTASNGVNLRCRNLKNEQQDFEGIHLLEERYFWFDVDDDKKVYLKNKKKAFWYLWKLKHKSEISPSDFKPLLRKANLKSMSLNSLYRKTQEFIFSSIALFHQALGRVDRQWEKEASPTEITLSKDVSDIFEDFLTNRRYCENEVIKKRDRYTATLILKLHEALREHFKIQNVQAELVSSEDVTVKNNTSRRVMKELLDEIRAINEGKYDHDPEVAREIIAKWKEIRECVLMQDYNAVIQFEKASLLNIEFREHFVHETRILHKSDRLFVSNSQLHPKFRHEIYDAKKIFADHVIERGLNEPFSPVRESSLLKPFFLEKEYTVNYLRKEYGLDSIFTPYIEQAILRGAIGEEAIKILLTNNGIFLEDDENISIRLFEKFDAKLRDTNVPTYLDFKNFSESTLDKYSLTEEDWEFDLKFDAKKFASKVQEKRAFIKNVTREKNTRYVIVNFIADRDRENSYFKENLAKVKTYSDCDIAVIPSALDRHDYHKLSSQFQKFLDGVKADM